MRAPVDGRRSPSAAPAGSRHPAAAGRGHRVSGATLRCAHCDRLTAAGWPEGVSRHTFGPSVQAWVSLLAGAYRLSKRNIRASDAFGLKVSLGTVSRRTGSGMPAPVEEARAFVRRQGIVNVDETGWRQRRAKAWLWTAVTDGVTVFSIRPSRGRDGVDEMLGADNTAVVGSDRYSAYAHLPLGRRQVCWAHLRAPSRSSWPGAERPSASVTTCWTAASSCLPGGIKSATVPCPGPACRRSHLCQAVADAYKSGRRPSCLSSLLFLTSCGGHLKAQRPMTRGTGMTQAPVRLPCLSSQRPRCCLQPTPPFVNISPQPFRPPAPFLPGEPLSVYRSGGQMYAPGYSKRASLPFPEADVQI